MIVSSRRRVAVGAAAAVVLLAAVALGASRGGDPAAGAGDGPLAWHGTTRVHAVPELPSDRVLTGRLRNTSPREVHLDAGDVRIVDADDRALRGTARFTAGFGHALYSPRDAPREVAQQERARLGEAVTVRPGASVPVTLSWRLEPGGEAPVAVRLGEADLRLPPTP